MNRVVMIAKYRDLINSFNKIIIPESLDYEKNRVVISFIKAIHPVLPFNKLWITRLASVLKVNH